MNNKPRLLVLEPRRLGDAVLSLPFIRSAVEKYEVHVCCPPASLPIYARLLPKENLWPQTPPWECNKGLGWFSAGFRWHLAELRTLDFDQVVSVWPDPRVHLWMNLIPSLKRVGFLMNRQNYYGWQRPWRHRQLWIGQILQLLMRVIWRRPLLNLSLEREQLEQSHLECWHQIATSLGLGWRTEVPWFPSTSLSGKNSGRDFIEQERQAGGKVLLIHLGAHARVRRWPLDRFYELMDRLSSQPNLSILIVNGPGQPEFKPRHASQCYFRPSDLNELIELTGAVDLVLCHDSLMAHLAAAQGLPVITLFGPQNPNWFAPFGNRERVIIEEVCPHSPCFDCCVMPYPICMEAIPVDRVFRAVTDFFIDGK